MELVTDQQIADAEQAVRDAEEQRAQVAAEAARQDFSSNRGQAMAYVDAKVRHAALKVERLRRLRIDQQSALSVRKTAEAAMAKEIGKLGKGLEASRDAAAQAITDAEASLHRMIEAVTAHDTNVRAASAQLLAKGLPLVDLAGEHETGGTTRSGLRLAGEWWAPVDAGAALARSVGGVAGQRLGRLHPLTSFGKHFRGVRELERRTDGLGVREAGAGA